MKKLAIITITLLTLSGNAFANDSGQQTTEAPAAETEQCITFTMIKEAFKLGFQSGWMVEK